MFLSTDTIFRVRTKDRTSYMNPIYRRDASGASEPLGCFYSSYTDALARLTRFMDGDIDDWEIVPLTQILIEDPSLKNLLQFEYKEKQRPHFQ
jgi:hypothetical protein